MKISKNKGVMLAVLVGSSALSPASLLYAAQAPQPVQLQSDCNKTGLAAVLVAGAGVTAYGASKLYSEYARRGYKQTELGLKRLLKSAQLPETKLSSVLGLAQQENKKLLALFNAKKKSNTKIAQAAYVNYINELIARYTKLESGLAPDAKSDNNAEKAGWATVLKAYAMQPFQDVRDGYASNDYKKTAQGALTLGAFGAILGGMYYVDVVGKMLGAFGLVKDQAVKLPQAPAVAPNGLKKKGPKDGPNGGGSSSSSGDGRGAQADTEGDEAMARRLHEQELADLEQRNLERAQANPHDDQDGRPFQDPALSDGPSDHGSARGSDSDSDDDDQGPGGQGGPAPMQDSAQRAVRVVNPDTAEATHFWAERTNVPGNQVDGSGVAGPAVLPTGGRAAETDDRAAARARWAEVGSRKRADFGPIDDYLDDDASSTFSDDSNGGPAPQRRLDLVLHRPNASEDASQSDSGSSAGDENIAPGLVAGVFGGISRVLRTVYDAFGELYDASPSVDAQAVEVENAGQVLVPLNNVADAARGEEAANLAVFNREQAEQQQAESARNQAGHDARINAQEAKAAEAVAFALQQQDPESTNKDGRGHGGSKRKFNRPERNKSSKGKQSARSNKRRDLVAGDERQDVDYLLDDSSSDSSSLSSYIPAPVATLADYLFAGNNTKKDKKKRKAVVPAKSSGSGDEGFESAQESSYDDFEDAGYNSDINQEYQSQQKAESATNGIADDILRENRIKVSRAKKDRDDARRKRQERESRGNSNLMDASYAPRRGNKDCKGKAPVQVENDFDSSNEDNNNNRKVGSNPFALLADSSHDSTSSSGSEASDDEGAVIPVDVEQNAQGWWHALRNLLRLGSVAAVVNAENDDVQPVLDTAQVPRKPEAQAFAQGAVPGEVKRVLPKRDKEKAPVVPVVPVSNFSGSDVPLASTQGQSGVSDDAPTAPTSAFVWSQPSHVSANVGISATDFVQQASGQGAALGRAQVGNAYSDARENFSTAMQDGVDVAHRAAQAGRQAAAEQDERFRAQQAANKKRAAELEAARAADQARLLGAGKKADLEGGPSVRPSKKLVNSVPPVTVSATVDSDDEFLDAQSDVSSIYQDAGYMSAEEGDAQFAPSSDFSDNDSGVGSASVVALGEPDVAENSDDEGVAGPAPKQNPEGQRARSASAPASLPTVEIGSWGVEALPGYLVGGARALASKAWGLVPDWFSRDEQEAQIAGLVNGNVEEQSARHAGGASAISGVNYTRPKGLSQRDVAAQERSKGNNKKNNQRHRNAERVMRKREASVVDAPSASQPSWFNGAKQWVAGLLRRVNVQQQDLQVEAPVDVAPVLRVMAQDQQVVVAAQTSGQSGEGDVESGSDSGPEGSVYSHADAQVADRDDVSAQKKAEQDQAMAVMEQAQRTLKDAEAALRAGEEREAESRRSAADMQRRLEDLNRVKKATEEPSSRSSRSRGKSPVRAHSGADFSGPEGAADSHADAQVASGSGSGEGEAGGDTVPVLAAKVVEKEKDLIPAQARLGAATLVDDNARRTGDKAKIDVARQDLEAARAEFKNAQDAYEEAATLLQSASRGGLAKAGNKK